MLNPNPVGGSAKCGFLLFVCILAMFAVSKSVIADENKHKAVEVTSVKRKTHHPHCGLYCLYTAMKLAEKEIDFRELVKPDLYKFYKNCLEKILGCSG